MARAKSQEYLAGMLRELCALSNETEWLEFKCNWHAPEDIGEYISALANSAALEDKANAYLVWGIEDESREISGTTSRVINDAIEAGMVHPYDPDSESRRHASYLPYWA